MTNGSPKKTLSTKVPDPVPMTADQFKAWLTAMNYTGAAAAKALGVSKATIVKYQHEGAPPSIRMACRVLYPKQDEAVFPWETAA